MILTTIAAILATLGFCIIFHVPARLIPAAALMGGLGWLIYEICLSVEMSPVVSCFAGALAVGFGSDVCARVLKDAGTIFTIPGIIPLVPGSGMYYTTLALVQHDLSEAATVGSQTIFIAGAIALGLLISGAVTRIVFSIIRYVRHGADQIKKKL